MTGSNRGLWAAFFAAGLGAVYAGLALTASGEIAVLAASVLVGLALLVLERVRPQQPAWRAPDGQGWHDLDHFRVQPGGMTWIGTRTSIAWRISISRTPMIR